MPTNRDVHQFLSGKMGLTRSDAGHAKYVLPRKLRRALPIMLPFHVQHGRGDVADHVLRQIARVLGISERELGEAIGCHYCDLVLYLSLLSAALLRLMGECARDPVVYERLLLAFCEGLPETIATVRSGCRIKAIRPQEGDLLRRIVSSLDERRLAVRHGSADVRKRSREALEHLLETHRAVIGA